MNTSREFVKSLYVLKFIWTTYSNMQHYASSAQLHFSPSVCLCNKKLSFFSLIQLDDGSRFFAEFEQK